MEGDQSEPRVETQREQRLYSGQDEKPDQAKELTVCAVVLTFNRLERLKECLAGILEQLRKPNKILVVDNNSSDGTQEYLESLSLENTQVAALIMSDNLGPAGGFAAGIARALEENYDFVWLCDDDSIPDKTCLQYQIDEAAGSMNSFVLSRNVDEKGGSAYHAAWRGVLVPTSAIRVAGLPNKDYFFSKEDTDWYWRLASCGVERKRSSDAVVHYWQYYQAKKATWKYYYWGRNTIYYRLRVQRCKWYSKRFRKMLWGIVRLWVRLILVESEKRKKARYLSLGIWHGLRGHMGKVIDPSNA